MKAKIKNSQERIGAPLPWFAKEKYLLAGLFIGSLMVYWPTLAPGVFFGDSGELAAAVDNMGIAHPPGYPLFLILGKIFTTLVPVGSLAMRMNLFSAVFASLTLVVLYLISRLLGQNGLVSLVSACLAGFCITFWDQAVVTEVYTMAAFLLFAMVYFLLAWHRTREVRFLLLLALTGGLGMTHHVSIAVYFPLMVLFVALQQPALLKNARLLGKTVLAFVAPLSLYVYLPLRSAANPPNDWGNPETLSAIIDHITARQFGNMFFRHGVDGVVFQLGNFIELLVGQWPIYVVVISLVGLVRGLWLPSSRNPFLFLLGLVVVNLAFSLGYFITDIDAYFITTYLALALAAGTCLGLVWDLMAKRLPSVGTPITVIAIVVMALVPVFTNRPEVDKSQNHLARTQVMNVLGSLEKDSVLFMEDETILFPMAYLHLAEGMSADTELYDMKQNIFRIPGFKSLQEMKPQDMYFFAKKMVEEGRPVYFSQPIYGDLRHKPHGLIYKVVAPNAGYEEDDVWSTYDLDDYYKTYNDPMSRETVAKHHLIFAQHQFRKRQPQKAKKNLEVALKVAGDREPIIKRAITIFMDQKDIDRALALAQVGEKVNPFDPDFQQIQGMVFHHRGDYEKALAKYNLSLKFRKDNFQVLLNRGLLHETQGDQALDGSARRRHYQRALDDIIICRRINPEHPAIAPFENRVKQKIASTESGEQR